MSGGYNYSEGIENYYILKQNSKRGIYKTSYIDLRYIYELECTNIPPNENIVTEKQMEEILKKIEKVQEKIKDENYKYIKEYYSMQ